MNGLGNAGLWNRGKTRRQHSTRLHYFLIKHGSIEGLSLCGMGYDPLLEDIRGRIPYYACFRCLNILGPPAIKTGSEAHEPK